MPSPTQRPSAIATGVDDAAELASAAKAYTGESRR